MASISAVLLMPAGFRAVPGLESVLAQKGIDVEVLVVAPDGEDVPSLPESVRVVRVDAAAPAATFRNTAIRAATAPYVCVLEGGERLEGTDALAGAVASLEQEPAAAASYGRTLVDDKGALRALPERGRSGRVLRPLVQYKSFIVSSASIVWRRALLVEQGYNPAYKTPMGLLLALLVEIGREHNFAFRQATTAVASVARDDLATLEEKVKIFVALLFGAARLDERIEVRVRFRLARHLVALGKHHYRQGDHVRAGKLFGEAVKAAPSYFKGRRYQFMNFLKGVVAR